MLAVFAPKFAGITEKLKKESLPLRETSSLITIALESQPVFSLQVSEGELEVSIQVEGKAYSVSNCLTLAFPSFPTPQEELVEEYFTASWEASLLGVIEALYPRVVPLCDASSWLKSFELSFARRPALTQKLGLPFAESIIRDGQYNPAGNEIIYDLETRSLLPARTGAIIEGRLEIFPSARLESLYSAVVFASNCWICGFSNGRMTPHYQGNIENLEDAEMRALFSRAAAEWKLANLVYLDVEGNVSLIQARFDVADALHPKHHASFIQALLDFVGNLQNGPAL